MFYGAITKVLEANNAPEQTWRNRYVYVYLVGRKSAATMAVELAILIARCLCVAGARECVDYVAFHTGYMLWFPTRFIMVPTLVETV